ncbi:MAG: glycosyltransferase involved in cell wall biosynthesis, partial [Cellvibrionaceae bacterium]
TRWWSKLRLGQKPTLITDTDDWEGWGGWNDIADYSRVQKYFFAWQETWGMLHCDTLTFASRELGDRAEKLGLPLQKSLYLPNGPGISTKSISPSLIEAKRQALGLGNRPTLLLYSRLFEFDTNRLVAILQNIVAQLPDLIILVVGAGLFAEQAAEFRARLAAVNLLDRMVDTGWLDEADLPETLLTADVGLYLMDDTLLNRTKCPVKLADMVALGLPVVAEGVGEVAFYVEDGKNGRLCASGDVNGIVTAVVELLKNRELAQQMGKSGRERHVQQFAWKIGALRLIEKVTELETR